MSIAQRLGWQVDAHNFCGGYFVEDKQFAHPAGQSLKQSRTVITSKGPTLLRRSGVSVLQQDVRIRQKGRLVAADKAEIVRQPERSDPLQTILLAGNIRLQQHQQLFLADQAQLNLSQQSIQLDGSLYHLQQNTHDAKRIDLWGRAEQAIHYNNGNVDLDRASLSTCAPDHPTWQIQARHIHLDHKKGTGNAKHLLLRLWDVPVFYLPYVSFSYDRHRKTGFLFPQFGHSSSLGYWLKFPFYWNLAPNYDLTQDVNHYSKRGFALSHLFRYLTSWGAGTWSLDVALDDPLFQKLKDTQSKKPVSSPVEQTYRRDLLHSSDLRGYLSTQNTWTLDEHTQLYLQLHMVTDSYYFRDYSDGSIDLLTNQLLNQLQLSHISSHWSQVINIEQYQTLHLLSQLANPVTNQYIHLPEWDAMGQYAQVWGSNDVSIHLNAVNLTRQADPGKFGQLNQGQRLHESIRLSHLFPFMDGTVEPAIALDGTAYHLPAQSHFKTARMQPILSVDSQWFFSRSMTWGAHRYVQTLAPHLFYLYVPYHDQSRLPLFDTEEMAFDLSQLFADNRFTGYDRLQDSNRLSAAIDSSWRTASGQAVASASLGVGYYFRPAKVCLDRQCPAKQSLWTPVVGELQWTPNPAWTLSASAAFDTGNHQMSSSHWLVDYHTADQWLIGAEATFLSSQHYLSSGPVVANDLLRNNLANAHWVMPLGSHWQWINYISYNMSQKRIDNYYTGLSFNQCCSAFRILISRGYQGSLQAAAGGYQQRYHTGVYVQFQLKGLGSVGNANPNTLLSRTIAGYQDSFKF